MAKKIIDKLKRYRMDLEYGGSTKLIDVIITLLDLEIQRQESEKEK